MDGLLPAEGAAQHRQHYRSSFAGWLIRRSVKMGMHASASAWGGLSDVLKVAVQRNMNCS